MARLGFADRDDLVQWGQSQGASADLPDLVRQLILETTPGVVSLGFATGVGVYGSGWDGTAKATPGGLNVPAGLSLWELSTRSDVNVRPTRTLTSGARLPMGHRPRTPPTSPSRRAPGRAAASGPTRSARWVAGAASRRSASTISTHGFRARR